MRTRALIVSLCGYADKAIKDGKGLEEAALLTDVACKLKELHRLLSEAEGPMSYGQWSTDFREKVKRAIA